jgi:creatinine amidohydrolase
MISNKWEELTPLEFDEAIEKSGGLCILPLGCIERHGDHISVGCDSFHANFVSVEAANREYAVVFPSGMWLGNVMMAHTLGENEFKNGKFNKRGYIAISPELLMNIMKELCGEIFRNGFRKILIANFHGGNIAFLNFFLTAINYEKQDGAVMCTNGGEITMKEAYERVLKEPERFSYLDEGEMAFLEKFAKTGEGGGHGDIKEVALCMYENEKYVRPDKYETFPYEENLTFDAQYLADNGISHGKSWDTNCPGAFEGYPSTGCTPNIGRVLHDLLSERLANMYKLLKNDEFCVEMSK